MSVNLENFKFWHQICPKHMTDKRFENIKILIRIQKCTPVRNFSHFVELQIMTPNLSHKMSDKNFEKINIKTEISI